jgi:triacylglycerol lipase
MGAVSKERGTVRKTRLFYIVFVIGSLLFFLFCGCTSVSKPAAGQAYNHVIPAGRIGTGVVLDNLLTEQEHFDSLSLKYPVILAHGIAMRDRGTVLAPWGRIPQVLKENDVEVFFGNTDAWGSIESNAELLKATVDKILEETGKEKVNIIAHSKGGLDSRYMIWKYKYGEKVASLTTISTPHHGAVVADLILNLKSIHTKAAKKSLEDLSRLYNDVYPDIYTAGYSLTTTNMEEFNRIVTMDDRVYYQSIYSIMNNAKDDLLFSSSYNYIIKEIGENDGLVSEYSARWGNNITKIEGGISHAQIIDIMRKERFDMKIPNIYLRIVNDLGNKGF